MENVPGTMTLVPIETKKTSRKAEPKVMGTESKKFANGLLGIIVSQTTPIFTCKIIPGSINPDYWKNNTIF